MYYHTRTSHQPIHLDTENRHARSYSAPVGSRIKAKLPLKPRGNKFQHVTVPRGKKCAALWHGHATSTQKRFKRIGRSGHISNHQLKRSKRSMKIENSKTKNEKRKFQNQNDEKRRIPTHKDQLANSACKNMMHK